MSTARGGSNVPFDTRTSEFIGDLVAWKRENAENNDEQMARLKKNLTRAIQNELTPHQQRVLLMHYSEGRTVVEIADTLGVNPSTVSRTLARGRARLRKVLQYSF